MEDLEKYYDEWLDFCNGNEDYPEYHFTNLFGELYSEEPDERVLVLKKILSPFEGREKLMTYFLEVMSINDPEVELPRELELVISEVSKSFEFKKDLLASRSNLLRAVNSTPAVVSWDKFELSLGNSLHEDYTNVCNDYFWQGMKVLPKHYRKLYTAIDEFYNSSSLMHQLSHYAIELLLPNTFGLFKQDYHLAINGVYFGFSKDCLMVCDRRPEQN